MISRTLCLLVATAGCAVEQGELDFEEGVEAKVSALDICVDGAGKQTDCEYGPWETGVESGGDRCFAWFDRDFEGDGVAALGVNRIYNYVGDDFNDEIGSFRVAKGAYILAWYDRDRGGTMKRFDTDAAYVGVVLNDRISSWACILE